MAFNKQDYDQQYNKANVITKRVPFNRQNPDDVELLEHLKQHENFTQYIKQLIRQDMAAGKK